MKNTATLTFTPSAHIVLSLEEVSYLCKLSQAHYDFQCKALSKQGGILYNVKDICEYETRENLELSTTSFSFHALDIILKVLEVNTYAGFNDPVGHLLDAKIRLVMKAMNDSCPKPVEFDL